MSVCFATEWLIYTGDILKFSGTTYFYNLCIWGYMINKRLLTFKEKVHLSLPTCSRFHFSLNFIWLENCERINCIQYSFKVYLYFGVTVRLIFTCQTEQKNNLTVR